MQKLIKNPPTLSVWSFNGGGLIGGSSSNLPEIVEIFFRKLTEIYRKNVVANSMAEIPEKKWSLWLKFLKKFYPKKS